MKKILFPLVLLCLLVACSSDIENQNVTDAAIDSKSMELNYTSDNAYNLNVIYFIPTDNPAVPDYENRISGILLHGQAFYKKWMNLNGYGDKTFGLLVDKAKKRVKIITIKGKFPMINYVSGKHDNMVTEINEYFAQNPSEKTSDHYLVIQPNHTLPEGIPYYASGRWGFCNDLPQMNVNLLGTGGDDGNKATTYIGGLLHEMGHAINLPHNSESVSQRASSEYGTALMGSGNFTYGKSPTFLTAVDCATLNSSQVFSKVNTAFYNQEPVVALNKISASYINGNIIVSGKFQSDIAVSSVICYNDPADDNADYDAVGWKAQTNADGTFTFNMPIAELHKKGNTPYKLRIRFCHTNGTISTFWFSYTFANDQPIIDFGFKVSQYDKSGWSVVGFSSNETSGEDGSAARIIDDNLNTSWLSQWSDPFAVHPHYITIDMKQSLSIKGFTIAMEQLYDTKSKDIEILLSNDGTTWESAGNFVLKEMPGPQHVYLSAVKNARYFKIIITSSWNGSGAANVSEIGAFNE